MSVIYGIRTFVPRMLAHGEPGHVVNTCSMTSVIAASEHVRDLQARDPGADGGARR